MTEEQIQNFTEQEAQASLQSRVEARLREMGIWFESVHDSITTRPEDAKIVNLVVDSEMKKQIAITLRADQYIPAKRVIYDEIYKTIDTSLKEHFG